MVPDYYFAYTLFTLILEMADGIEDGKSNAPESTKEKRADNLPKLLERRFQDINQDNINQHNTNDDTSVGLRVMQWNVLAQGLSGGDDNFVKCPVEALVFDRRKLQLLEEILTYNPDIICLEEVDMFYYLDEQLSELGYSGIFYPKRDSPCLDIADNLGPDGCAMFYKSDKLRSQKLFTTKLSDMRSSSKEKELNHVAVFQSFQLIKHGGPEIVVATTHFKAKAGNEELRAEEGRSLLRYLKQEFRKSLPVIICGDMNGDPWEPVYQVFANSDLDLYSAYRHLSDTQEEPKFTTIKIRGARDGGTKEAARTIDYMWYSKQKVAVKSLLHLPDLEEIGEGRLPSLTYPSDHLSLVTDFIIKMK